MDKNRPRSGEYEIQAVCNETASGDERQMNRPSSAVQNWIFSVLFLALFGLPVTLMADCQITLGWDPGSQAYDGYRIFQRRSGENYDYSQFTELGPVTSSSVSSLINGTTYHFVIRGFVGSLESVDSNEATYQCPTPTSTSDTNPPYTPNTVAPADMQTDVSLQPTLVTSPYYDEDSIDTHTQTRWQIFRVDNDASVLDILSSSALTSLTVPSSTLQPFTAYYWTARYYNQRGGVSAAAPYSEFTTRQSDSGSEEESSILSSSGNSGGGGSSNSGLAGGCFIETLF